MSEPILTKREPTKNSYKKITWEVFLKIRSIAVEVSDAIGYPVYLVGSVLYKDDPRDIDISVIMPIDEYEKRYGKLSDDPHDRTGNLHISSAANVEYKARFMSALEHEYDIDFKVCADTWFTEKPKMLLAAPKGVNKDGT